MTMINNKNGIAIDYIGADSENKSGIDVEMISEYVGRLNNISRYHIGFCTNDISLIADDIQELIDDGNLFFYAHNGSEITGVMGYDKYNKNVELWGPFCEHENNDILDQLWDRVESSIAEKDMIYIVHADGENIAAQEFALRNGFRLANEGEVMSLNLKNYDTCVDSNIREIKASDYDSAINLHDKCFAHAYYNGEQLIKQLDEENMIHVIEQNGVFAGYVNFNLDLGDAGIDFIAIDEAFRGKGYGEKLIRSALNEIKANDIDEITLWVDVKNENAINLYKKVGFKNLFHSLGYHLKI